MGKLHGRGRVGEEKRRGGYLIWVIGPALVHSRARADFEWFIRNGYVQAVLAGRAHTSAGASHCSTRPASMTAMPPSVGP